MKRCNACKQMLPLESYSKMKQAPDGHQYKCRSCMNAYKRRWGKDNAERLRIQRRNADIRRYGLEPEDYDALLAAQGGACAICKGAEPTEGHSLHIDHCHKTMKVRGLLCGRCNRALGLLKDDQGTMWNAVEYLIGAESLRRMHVRAYPTSELAQTGPGEALR